MNNSKFINCEYIDPIYYIINIKKLLIKYKFTSLQ